MYSPIFLFKISVYDIAFIGILLSFCFHVFIMYVALFRHRVLTWSELDGMTRQYHIEFPSNNMRFGSYFGMVFEFNGSMVFICGKTFC